MKKLIYKFLFSRIIFHTKSFQILNCKSQDLLISSSREHTLITKENSETYIQVINFAKIYHLKKIHM